jgi:hypothetical protein
MLTFQLQYERSSIVAGHEMQSHPVLHMHSIGGEGLFHL